MPALKMPRCLSVLFILVAAVAVTASRSPAEEITIHRDDFGTPHIFAETAAGACYGMGYVQAEDRLEELLKQYLRATGRMSEFFGPSNLRDDWRQRLWQHANIAKEKYPQLSAKSRAIMEAYQAGVKQYMKEHPDKVPAWAPALEPWMCVALGRYIIWGWPEGDAGGDMMRGGVKPDDVGYRGSNEWVVAPGRTAYKAPIALIDPHLSWYGAFRFYEARLYGGELEISGMAIPGMPIPSLGHSRYCSIAMTTGGPDAADCYEEEINPDNARQYKYDGKWRDMTVKTEIIRVKEGDKVIEKSIDLEYTHHGPVVARKDGKAYVLKLPYFDEVGLADQTYETMIAKNLNEMKNALAKLQLMEQNVMVATVEGDIFYVRNGRVPQRDPQFDYKKPLAGNTSKTEWRGIHPFEDLIQFRNPPTGYMQNCNVSPQFLAKGIPLKLADYKDRPWLFNGYVSLKESDRNDNPLHQRAAMCLNLLDAEKDLTVEEAIGIAMNPQVYGADVWQKMLKEAWQSADDDMKKDTDLAKFCEVILQWNGRCEPTTKEAIAYHYWKDQIYAGDDLVKLYDRAGFPPPKHVNGKLILAALKPSADKLKSDFGRFDVAYGDVYRVGRKGAKETWPVGGGSVDGIATPRAVGFDKNGDDKTFIGRGGQTSTQIVLLSNPPKSWTVLPLGNSDDPQSKHFDDQAEKLFSKGQMKPTYFLDKEELMKHVESTKVLTWAAN